MIKKPLTITEYLAEAGEENPLAQIPNEIIQEYQQLMKTTKWLNVASWKCTFSIKCVQKRSDEFETSNSIVTWSGSGTLVSAENGKRVPHAEDVFELLTGKSILIPLHTNIWTGKKAKIDSGYSELFYAWTNKSTDPPQTIVKRAYGTANTGTYIFPDPVLSFGLSFMNKDDKLGLNLSFPKPKFEGDESQTGGSWPVFLNLPDEVQSIYFEGKPFMGNDESTLKISLVPQTYYAVRLFDESSFEPVPGVRFKLKNASGSEFIRVTNEHGVIELPCEYGDSGSAYVVHKVSDAQA